MLVHFGELVLHSVELFGVQRPFMPILLNIVVSVLAPGPVHFLYCFIVLSGLDAHFAAITRPLKILLKPFQHLRALGRQPVKFGPTAVNQVIEELVIPHSHTLPMQIWHHR